MTAALLASGARVLVADIDPLPAGDISAHTDRLAVVRADVTDEAQAGAAVRACLDHFGALDTVVNNAGILMREVRKRIGGEGPVRWWDVDAATIRAFIDVHVVGAFLMAKAALPHMMARGSGRIIFVTTSFSTMLDAGRMPYGPAKAAMEASASVMAKDLAGTGVTVNVVIPGHPPPGTRARSEARLADGRHIQPRVPPEVMGPPVVWLSSADASGVTGMRFIANRWDPTVAPSVAMERAGAPIGWAMLDRPE